MSALPPEADMLIVGINVYFVPKADIRTTRFLEPEAECIPTINSASRCRNRVAYCQRNSIDSTMPASGKEERDASCHVRSNFRAQLL